MEVPASLVKVAIRELVASQQRRAISSASREPSHAEEGFLSTMGPEVPGFFSNPSTKTLGMMAFPSPVSEGQMKRMAALAPKVNSLYDQLARDHSFIAETFKSVALVDPFQAKVLELYQKTSKISSDGSTASWPQPATLALNRADYILNGTQDFLQVEVNTISCGFSGLMSRTPEVHRDVLQMLQNRSPPEVAARLPSPSQIMANNACAGYAAGINAAANFYNSHHKSTALPTAVIMLVQERELNLLDQGVLMDELYHALTPSSPTTYTEGALATPFSSHGVGQGNCPPSSSPGAPTPSGAVLVRATLLEASERLEMLENSKEGEPPTAIFTTQEGQRLEVGLFYFRCGYTPADFPSEKEWDARLLMEQSIALKAPNAAYQLVGAKAVQQRLTTPGVLEKYISDPEEAKEMRAAFADQYDLSLPENKAAHADGLANPSTYVLKPQREGGGNNLYDDKLLEVLRKYPAGSPELAAFVLMQLIVPPSVSNVPVLDGAAPSKEIAIETEFGTYSVMLSTSSPDTGAMHLENHYVGTISRSKDTTVRDGGVMNGVAKMDSILIVPDSSPQMAGWTVSDL